ncbi:hypothetical protein ACIXR2_05205 [Bacteroides fragilis]
MKKIYFVFFIMLVASMSSMAQVKFGIETGMTASRIVSGQRITESTANSAGVQIGLVVDFTLVKMVADVRFVFSTKRRRT